MVKSKLDSEINYPEKKDLLVEDINKLSVVYEYSIHDINVEIAIGSKISYLDKPIIFFPAYLVFNDKYISQIGLFELNEKDNYLDNDGDIDIDLLNDILLYKFTTKKYLEKYKLNEDVSHNDTSDEDTSDEDTSDDEGEEENWVNDYLGETKVKIYDQLDDGHCFFSAVQMAFSKKYTVKQMRELLSDIVDPSQYDTYSALYIANKEEIKALSQEKKELTKKIREIKKQYEEGKIADKDKKLKLSEAKQLNIKIKSIAKDKIHEEEIQKEYRFMDGVSSIDDLKEKIKTCDFWADSWAISKLEDLLKIKVIILSSDYYNKGELNKVVQCPEKKDREIKPEHYVIVDHTGNHYKLVTYNGHKLFKFETIPESLKRKIVETCMTTGIGSFHEIEDFRKYDSSI